MNDKSLYRLYRSHEGGAKEHLSYMSMWKSKKVLFMFAGVFVVLAFILSRVSSNVAFLQGKANPVPAESAPLYPRDANVVYVKYVVCGDFSCKATRPDGTVISLPLDYDSGKYPIEVRKYVKDNPGYYAPSPRPAPGAAGVPHAR